MIVIMVFFSSWNTFGTRHVEKLALPYPDDMEIIATFPWEEGFETGTLPSGWIQEQVHGYENWIFRNGSPEETPPIAHSGNFNACFFTTEYEGYSTKLITPELDLSQLNNPELTFWHAQADWAGDYDQLKVYYRISGTGNWIPLASYTDIVSEWTERVISLSSIPSGSVCQIAFEGISYYGSGVCIDDISIKDQSCPRISDFTVHHHSPVDVDLEWNSDPSHMEWILSYRSENNPVNTEETVYAPFFTFPAGSLGPNTLYTVNIRSVCGAGDTSTASTYTFRTLCHIEFPLLENFDNAESMSSAPECWSSIKDNPATSAYIDDYEYYSSPNAYWMYNSYVSSGNLALISPVLPVTVSQIRMNFMVSGSHGAMLEIGYLTDPDDFSSFVLYRTIPVTNGWSRHEIYFDNVTDSAYLIAFKHGFAYSYEEIYLDDMVLDIIPDCEDIHTSGIKFRNITTTGSEIIWEEIENATGYDVRYRIKGTTGWTEENSGSHSLFLENLSASTAYDISIRSLCEEGEGAWSTPVVLWTAFEVPFSEYLDSTETAGGWSSLFTAGSRGEISPVTGTGNVYSAPGAMCFNNGNSTSYDRMFWASPVIDPDVDRNYIQVRFKAKSNAYGVNLSVGLMNKDSIGSFSLMESVSLSSDWNTYIVTFENPSDFDQCIAFGHNGNPSSTLIYMDHIEIDYIPQCPEVSNITVSEYTGEGFTLAWRDTYQPPYTIEYEVTGSEDPQTVTSATYSYVFDNLTELTLYTIRIKGNCLPERWSDSITVSTIQVPAEIPYTEDFETNPQWLFVNGSEPNGWIIGNDTVANAGSGGSRCLYISDNDRDYHYTYYATHAYAYKTLSFDESGDYIVKYEWKNRGAAVNNGYVQVWLAPAGAPFQAGSAPVTAGWINIYGPSSLWNQTTWQENEMIAVIPNPGTYNLIFYWNNNYFGDNPPAAIDNIEIIKAECSTPVSISAQNVTSEGAEIVFKAPSDAGTVILYYRINGQPVWTDSVEIVMTDPDLDTLYSLTALSANTSYDFCLATLCGDGSRSYKSPVLRFKTGCVPLLTPWTENFDLPGTFPPNSCWSGKKYRYHPSAVMHTADMEENMGWGAMTTQGNRAAMINVYGSSVCDWLITPEVDLGSGGEFLLQFDIKLEDYDTDGPPSFDNDDKFVVLISTDGGSTWDPALATEWSSGDEADYPFHLLNEHYQTVTLPLTGISGIVKIAFYGESVFYGVDNNLYIDNISISKCLAPSRIKVYDFSDNSAKINWVADRENISEWEVVFGIPGFHPDSVPVYTVYDTVFELTGLIPDTDYVAYVRSICGDSDYSAWTEKNFTSPCESISEFPFTESFEPSGGTSSCWRIIDKNGDGVTWETDDYSPYTGNYSMSIYTDYQDGRMDDYLISPPFELTGNEQLRFFIKGEHPDEHDSYRILLSTTDDNPEDFTTLLFDGITSSSTLYEEITVDLSGYSGKIYIAFHMAPGSLDGYMLYLDDIHIENIPTCLVPVNLQSSAPTGNSVSLDWDEQNEATAWEIEYGPIHFTPGSGTVLPVSNKPYLLTGLTASSAYRFHVRSVCDEGDTSEWSTLHPFYTACENAMPLPYTENFDTYPATHYAIPGWAPVCWITHTDNTQYPPPHIVNGISEYAYIHSSPNSLIMTSGGNGANSFAVLPAFTDSVFTLQVTFHAAVENYTRGTLTVGYMENGPEDFPSYRAVYTVPFTQDETMNPYSVDFTEYNVPLHARHIAFHWNYNSSYYSVCLDDIQVQKVTPAACNPPVSVSAALLDYDEIMVNWSPGGNETRWILEYRDSLSPLPYQSRTIQSPRDTLRQLSPNTCYHIRIKAVCGAGRESEYAELYITTGNVQFTVTATADEGGIISPSGEIRVEEGSNLTFTIGAHAGSRVSDVVINGESAGELETYTFRNIRGDSSIHVATVLGLADHEENTVFIYPNPATDILIVETASFFDQMEIASVTGQILYRKSSPEQQMEIDLSSYPTGIYFIILQDRYRQTVHKFIKK